MPRSTRVRPRGRPPTRESSSMAAVQKVTETASTDLAALLDGGDGAVVTLVAGDMRLVAHRAVLMDRSPVFAAMFAHDTQEASSGEVAIEDVEGPVLRQLVCYLYTLRVPQLSGMAQQLLAAADKYGVSGMKAAYEKQVAAQLTVETAATDLAALLDAGDGTVVTLLAGATRLVAHRAILMDRSPVFAAMFAHDMLEASRGEVAIADVEGPVLRQLVCYLYTLRAPQLPGMAPQLLAAADKYGVCDLKAACEQQVATQLTVETAAATAVLAVKHSLESLTKDAINFIKDRGYQVMATQGWADAMLSQPRHLVEVSRLLAEPPPDIRNLPAEKKNRRLIQAVEEGDVREVEALLAAGADVAAREEDEDMNSEDEHTGSGDEHEHIKDEDSYTVGDTALHLAAARGHVEAVRRLIAHRAPVGARNIDDGTPLHEAARNGHAAVVRLLLAASADHSATDCLGYTPLHAAAHWGHAEAAKALLQAGADRGATDNFWQTPLDLAREKNHQCLVDLLSGS